MSNYCGSIEVPRVPWFDGPRGYDVLDSEAHLQFIFAFGYGSSIKLSLRLYLSQVVRVSCTGRKRALVHYQCYIGYTPTDRNSNHNSPYRGYPRSLLLVILVVRARSVLRDHGLLWGDVP